MRPASPQLAALPCPTPKGQAPIRGRSSRNGMGMMREDGVRVDMRSYS